MHDLRLVGVHEDGEHLVLSGADGEQYLLRIDEPVRAAVRRDRALLGQLQIEISGELRPRDVQAQIRGGASAQDVSSRTGWPLDRVSRYEGAVLAERAHIADLGRGVTLRRRGSDPVASTLGARVDQRLAARGVDVTHNEWDSWRSEDGPWMLTLRFTAGGRDRLARWAFDVGTRTVSPQDDEAQWLSEDEKPPAPPTAAPHLSAVPTMTAVTARPDDRVYDLAAEGGLGVETPETVHLSTSAVDLVGAMRQRRHGRRRHGDTTPPIGSPASPDAARASTAGNPPAQEADVVDVRSDEPAPVSGSAAHPFPFAEGLHPDEPVPSRRADDTQGKAVLGQPAGPPRNFGPPRPVTAPNGANGPNGPKNAPPTGAPAARPDPSRRARRPSVPSWDEIMFGGKRD